MLKNMQHYCAAVNLIINLYLPSLDHSYVLQVSNADK